MDFGKVDKPSWTSHLVPSFLCWHGEIEGYMRYGKEANSQRKTWHLKSIAASVCLLLVNVGIPLPPSPRFCQYSHFRILKCYYYMYNIASGIWRLSFMCTDVLLLMQVKQPGLEMSTVQSELDLSYGQRYQGVTIPEAYERLILDTYDLISILNSEYVLAFIIKPYVLLPF